MIFNRYIINNTNALYDASRRNNIEEVKRLIDAGIDINQGDNSRFTPLSFAILNRRTEIAKMLIDAGADVNKANSAGRTPLF